MGQIFVWTLKDIIGLVIFAFFVLIWLAIAVPDAIRKARCKHDATVNETSACDAICQKCGKNLGFIGTWREKNRGA